MCVFGGTGNSLVGYICALVGSLRPLCSQPSGGCYIYGISVEIWLE